MTDGPTPPPPPQPGPYQPPYTQPYGQPVPGQPYGAPPPYGMPPPTSSKATTSLVLGIASLVMCGLFLGIPAMIVGRQAKREITASRGQLGGEGLATAGFVTGLIATIISVLGFLLVVGLFAFGAAFSTGHSCSATTDSNGNVTSDCS